ncbi:IS256 family transposase [Capillibacterium thermochitinicola]|uniref:Mutator family transposase n=1 Tax=Capillibacterium thermochitinicola TaxID=2699427 RepID=A0A8J6LJE9_9FIRM|nr:IS256 family transposase [Capillibacterium thermochitinicola]MBA2133786.1 IS256 family transposase [Capillibacterium thermochitinicola]
MSNIIQFNEDVIKNKLNELVRGSVEETLNQLLDQEADRLTNAARYERTEARKDTRAGYYQRSLETKAGKVNLKVPKLRKLPFETAIIERYKRRESSIEEALIEMYLAGVSVRRIEDITEILWGSKVSPGTISKLNKKVYSHIEDWRNRPLDGEYPYVYLDGIYLKRNWGGEYENVSILVALAVNNDGYREILGAAEGSKEDKESWLNFLRHLKERGLKGTQLFISDKCLGVVETLGEIFPEARWQRCVVHFYRNIFSVVPTGKVKLVAAMLKAIHAQEDLASAKEKASAVVRKLREMKLPKAAEKVETGIEETLSYMHFPREHWLKIRTNNGLERLMREIRRRTRVVGSFPDGHSALMLVCARLRHVASSNWGLKRYLNMKLLVGIREEVCIG